MTIVFPGRTEFQQATHQRRVFLFHTLDKGKANAKPAADEALVQRPYLEEFKSSGESCVFDTLEVSEVSVLSTLRSDTWLGSMPNFFIRVMNVVRLSPRRAAAPSRPPTRPPASCRAWTI